MDIYHDAMATRNRLRDTLNHKKRPCHAELVTEGKKRLVRMTDALAKFKADSRATVRAAIKVLNQGDFRLMSLTVLLTPVNQTNARRYQKIASTVVWWSW